MSEAQFESDLIDYLTTISGTKQWQYEPKIKTTEDLWNNFKEILESNNQNTLDYPLSPNEFNQVKKIISDLHTPYEAGQFLYGFNGISEIEIDLDDGRHVYLMVFDQKQIGAGDTIYQVVNQIYRPAIIIGKQDRIFDTTLLINGLPIIQIEEKKDTRNVDEALNQMHQYIDEKQYSNIFSTLQILIGITPNNVKYMANTTPDNFNKDFAFNWQKEQKNKSDDTINSLIPVRRWQEFATQMLSIPMAHQMATNYMILDGTPNKQMLKVMRPYQVYATKKVIDGIKAIDFELSDNKIGYIWHTTGSGKTITSFKTAWLASKLPRVDKVVFVVDRIALTKQTSEHYRSYDPDGDIVEDDYKGSIEDTKTTNDLNRKIKSKSNNIIVTSVQKLGTLVSRKNFKAPDKNIVFIVDEAHRSTAGDNFSAIQKAFKNAAWVGYTGTPMFDETTSGLRTEDIFGPMLDAYTIREAIADRNVLGFKVDFETTIDEEKMRTKYLPKFYKDRNPDWSEEDIQNKIDNLNDDDIDDTIEPSFYDNNEEHVELVVRDIFDKWNQRSNQKRYNALLTTHVGGGKASTPMAMLYYNTFQKINAERLSEGKDTLKVAVTFSLNTSNNNTQLETNKGLHEAIMNYNKEFNVNFSMSEVSEYTQDVISRLNKTATNKKYLDLVIVIDQLLTGFDAPELNTLYVDRTLKNANLIQAYSRTNRVEDMQEKPWGRVVNYRWPKQNERLMNDALAIYADRSSAETSDEEKEKQNKKDNIVMTDFKGAVKEVKTIVDQLRTITQDFNDVPASETKQEEMLSLLRQYNAGMSKLKQYTAEDPEDTFEYGNTDKIIEQLGMDVEEEKMLTVSLANELKNRLSEKKQIPAYQIDLKMTHIKDIRVNYDYLTELVEKLLNQIHNKENAKETMEEIQKFANSLEDRSYASKISKATEAIVSGEYEYDEYPANLDNSEEVIEKASQINLQKQFLDFKNKWGLVEVVTTPELLELFARHKFGMQDLDDKGEIREIIMNASSGYKVLANDEEVKSLSKIKYRNNLREAIYKFADQLVIEGQL